MNAKNILDYFDPRRDIDSAALQKIIHEEGDFEAFYSCMPGTVRVLSRGVVLGTLVALGLEAFDPDLLADPRKIAAYGPSLDLMQYTLRVALVHLLARI